MAKTVAQQRIKELKEAVQHLQNVVHYLEADKEILKQEHQAEIRKLKDEASLEEARQLMREAELLAQRRQLIELLARIEKGAV
jgi:hypothetical protein